MRYTEEQAKLDVSNISEDLPLFQKMLKFNAILTKYMEYLNQYHAYPIVVGGLSMEIYTGSEYVTYDIDVASTASSVLHDILIKLDFKKESRLYINERLNIAFEIVTSTLEPSEYDRLVKIELDDNNYLYSISPEDILYDRALSYEYADTEKYGIYLLTTNFETLDIEYIRQRLKQDDSDALASFNNWVEIARKQYKKIK